MRVLSALVFVSALVFGQSFAALSGEETKSIAELYEDAIKEGGKLVVYHGGDTPTQQNALKTAFSAAFPKINFTVVVDYSKVHDARIDNQLETNSLVPDVVALQTLQDFPRWKSEGHLLNYKPANFSKIYDGFKDPNGAWMAYTVIAFNYASNTTTLGSLAAPATPLDLVDPKYKGLIASSYPHDDDAALFLYTQYVQKYGWEWVAKLATQDVAFARGSQVAGEKLRGGVKPIGMAGSVGSFQGPIDGHYPFLAWGQRLAIFKKAKNPAAAKLLVNWLLSTERQSKPNSGWSVRTDLPTTNGFKQVWEIPEANVAGFPKFMDDRERVEQWKQTFALYFGEVQGAPTPGVLGLHPGL
uniref:ABC transporter substrate-binding protein n=1 Tax=Globisporangium ultimum (strain ATCC 200006 / CBS 805.95 / DAOM BR144) TaxID=431595 RepID=K3WIY1_GLOUD